MKPFAIVSACDANHGDFAVRHWLPSLLDSVDLEDVDVWVLDYGLTQEQRQIFASAGVSLRREESSEQICSARHQGLVRLLEDRGYEQATLVDCGDLIFQRDISPLFRRESDRFRAVCEDVFCDFLGQMMRGEDFAPAVWRRTLRELRDRPMINGSGVIAPARLWFEFHEEFRRATISRDHFGTDQAFINIHLHRTGFASLPSTVNFSLKTTRQQFSIRDGRFYDGDGELIAVVHNSGGRQTSRAVRRFGYGPDRNQSVRSLGRLATHVTYRIRRRLRR